MLFSSTGVVAVRAGSSIQFVVWKFEIKRSHHDSYLLKVLGIRALSASNSHYDRDD